MQRRKLPVYLYVPNILGYIRIVMAMVGLYICPRHPITTLIVWFISGALDFFDGMLARKLNQTSTLGVYLDIIADIILRGACWMAYAMMKTKNYERSEVAMLISFGVWTLEWITMLCTQLQQQLAKNNLHWKEQSTANNWFISLVFKSNFKNPIGFWVMYGLFTANAFAYGDCFGDLFPDLIPFHAVWKWFAYTGRALAAGVELSLCYNFIQYLVSEQDEPVKKKE